MRPNLTVIGDRECMFLYNCQKEEGGGVTEYALHETFHKLVYITLKKSDNWQMFLHDLTHKNVDNLQ